MRLNSDQTDTLIMSTKGVSNDTLGQRVPYEDDVTEPMLRGVQTSIGDSGPLPRLAVDPNRGARPVRPISLEIGAEEETQILPARKRAIQNRGPSWPRSLRWGVFGGIVVVGVAIISVPSGFAIGHFLGENLQEHVTVSPDVDVTDANPAPLPATPLIPSTEKVTTQVKPLANHPPFVVHTVEKTFEAPPERLDAAWNMVSQDPNRAKQMFTDHLVYHADDPEGHYGLGYLYLKEGRLEDASHHLCKAKASQDAETARDVRHLIKRNRLRCDASGIVH